MGGTKIAVSVDLLSLEEVFLMHSFGSAFTDLPTACAASTCVHVLTEADVNELLLQLLTSQPVTSEQENHSGSCRSSYI